MGGPAAHAEGISGVPEPGPRAPALRTLHLHGGRRARRRDQHQRNRPREISVRLSRLLRLRAPRGPGLHAGGPSANHPHGLSDVSPSPRRREHSTLQRPIDRARRKPGVHSAGAVRAGSSRSGAAGAITTAGRCPPSDGPHGDMPADIRLATVADAAAVAAIYRPYVETTAFTFETEPPSEGEMRRRIGETLISYPWLVCESAGRILGYAYASAHRTRAAYRWSVDTAIYVDAGSHRRGLGRELCEALFPATRPAGLLQRLRRHHAAERSERRSERRSRALNSLACRKVGFKAGAWHDVGWWVLQAATSRAQSGRAERAQRDLTPSVSKTKGPRGRSMSKRSWTTRGRSERTMACSDTPPF